MEKRLHSFKIIFVIVGVVLATMLGLLAGCTTPTQPTTESDPVTVYKTNLKAAASDVVSRLEAYDEAVEGGNIYTIRSSINNVFTALDGLTSIEAPADCSEVQKNYVAGCNDLRDALNSYLELLTAMENATDEQPFDYASYQSQLDGIQSQYTNGINALQAGDQTLSSL